MATTTGVQADWSTMPSDLPVPVDDGAADHLRDGQVEVPSVVLQATATGAVEDGGGLVDVRAASLDGPVLVFVYPRTGRPGVANPDGWDAIPGARGCTPELCGVRDNLDGLRRRALPRTLRVFGLSTQSPAYQSEVAARLGLPYPILSDEGARFSGPLGLPTFAVPGLNGDGEGETRLLKRLTLLVYRGKVVGRDYPVFPSDEAAERALGLLALLD